MTEDEHPNERLVTPSEDGEGFDRSLVSRRSMLGGSALLAGLLAYTSDPTDPQLPGRASGSAAGIVRASDNPDEPLIILGPESDPVGYLFQDTAGGIILQDATSGNHFWYNESQGRWETDAPLDIPSLVDESILSFFDGSELTADVNNTSTTTDQATLNGADGHTIGGDTLAGFPTSSDAGITLGGGWTQIDADRPSFLILRVQVETDGSSNGQIALDVDESGGTSSDYLIDWVIGSGASAGASIIATRLVYVPPGAQVRLRNISDPNNGNNLITDRKVIL